MIDLLVGVSKENLKNNKFFSYYWVKVVPDVFLYRTFITRNGIEKPLGKQMLKVLFVTLLKKKPLIPKITYDF